MGNIIANLLSADEVDFSKNISLLEKNAGNPSVDVRLMSEIISTSRQKVSALGLDSNDCTGEELYYSLMTKAKLHDSHLARHIGVSVDDTVDKIALGIEKIIKKSNKDLKNWSIKKSVAKKMLKEAPPKNVMNYLHYQSIDSMLKRENLAEIYGAIRLLENDKWLRKYNQSYNKLMPSDFEEREIEFLVMPSNKWSKLSDYLYANKKYSLTHLKELGFIILFAPQDKKLEGYTISTLPQALHYINEIKLYSTFFKLQQVKPDFGKIIVRTLNEDDVYDINISGKKIHWRAIQKHFGSEKINHPDMFQSHIQPDDLTWEITSQLLYKIDPELNFWKDLDYVGVLLNSNKPISFNILDVSMNYYFAIPFQERLYSRMQSSLWNELHSRYIREKVYEAQIHNQLSSSTIDFNQLRF